MAVIGWLESRSYYKLIIILYDDVECNTQLAESIHFGIVDWNLLVSLSCITLPTVA